MERRGCPIKPALSHSFNWIFYKPERQSTRDCTYQPPARPAKPGSRGPGFIGVEMETWVLIMTLRRDGETAPVQVPMIGYEQCMAAGAEAEGIAKKLKGTKLT